MTAEEALAAECRKLQKRVEELESELRRERNKWKKKPPFEFVVRYNLLKVLSLDDLWPEEDWPEDPTEEDVRALIERDGGILNVLQDWNLDSDPLYGVERRIK